MKYLYDNTFDTPLQEMLDQTFCQFRAAYAHDFHLRTGNNGFITHCCVGGGLEFSMTHWHLEQLASDPALTPPPPRSLTHGVIGERRRKK